MLSDPSQSYGWLLQIIVFLIIDQLFNNREIFFNILFKYYKSRATIIHIHFFFNFFSNIVEINIEINYWIRD